jgi:hypothetical protein
MEQNNFHGIAEINSKYQAFRANIFEVYEDYLFQSHYLPVIHSGIKPGNISVFNFEDIYTGRSEIFKTDSAYGVIDRQRRKVIGQRALLDAVSATESFLQRVTLRVYRDFQWKLKTTLETPEQQAKLLEIIINSEDKNEIISKIAEEKIRGIFYGNPIDFFEKDKAKIGLGNHFKDNYKSALKLYSEIIARRNIIAHNDSRVDRKYLREVNDSAFSLGERVSISKDYIKEWIFILHSFAAITVEQVVKNNYGGAKIKEKYMKQIGIFDEKYKNK